MLMPQENQNPVTVARKTFEFIKAEFPRLEMKIDEHPANSSVGIEMIIPIQNELSCEIRIILAGEELILAFSEFHWHFSCTDWEEQNWCIETIVRLVTNEARLKESLRGKRVVKLELQILHEGEWVTDMVTGTMSFPIFSKKNTRYIQNTSCQAMQ